MSSKPINISFFGGGDDKMFCQNIFHLTVFHNNTATTFEDASNDKYINIITSSDSVQFDSIKCYELTVNMISFVNETYSIKNMFTVEDDMHVHKENNIYIEFRKNEDGTANCCIHINKQDSRIFFTPPNY